MHLSHFNPTMIRGSLKHIQRVNTQARFLSNTGGPAKRPLELKKASATASSTSNANPIPPKPEAMPIPSAEQGGGPGILSLASVALLGAGAGAIYKAGEDKEVSFEMEWRQERSGHTSNLNY